MSKRYRNVGPHRFAGIAPGDVGELDLSEGQEARHVKSGRLVVQDGPSTSEPVSDPEYVPDATAPEPTTPPGLGDEQATEQEDD